MKLVLYAILAYIIFQFIFKLVIPVYLASRKIKKGFREMQSKMQEHPFDFTKGQSNQGFTPASSPSKEGHKKGAEDYIDYEEVK